MKKTILIALAFVALLGGRQAHATNASLSIFTSTAPASPGGTTVAAPPTGQYTVLDGCMFSNGYSAGECATISSSVTTEPSFELCAPSSSSFRTGDGYPSNLGGKNINGIAAMLGRNLYYSGALTVTGTATQSNVLLTCGYHTTTTLGL